MVEYSPITSYYTMLYNLCSSNIGGNYTNCTLCYGVLLELLTVNKTQAAILNMKVK